MTLSLADLIPVFGPTKPVISFTDFVDFYLKVGEARATHVRQVKERGPYEPAFDFYKRLREGILEYHAGGQPFSYLQNLAASQTDEKKATAYPEVVAGYKKFIGNKKIQFFDPPASVWTYDQLSVRINPELGLIYDKQAYVVKLFFKESPKITKPRTAGLAHLMYRQLASECPGGTKMAILDVRNGKLHAPTVPTATLDALIQGEAASFLAMWQSL